MARNIATEQIARAILVLRGQRVLLDAELAALYDVAPKVLLQAVKRNRKRFPADFMMQLNAAEWAALRSQSVTSNPQRGGRRYRLYAFTEQGVAMLSTVLKSDRAITINIRIMRAFVILVRHQPERRPFMTGIRRTAKDRRWLDSSLEPQLVRSSLLTL